MRWLRNLKVETRPRSSLSRSSSAHRAESGGPPVRILGRNVSGSEVEAVRWRGLSPRGQTPNRESTRAFIQSASFRSWACSQWLPLGVRRRRMMRFDTPISGRHPASLASFLSLVLFEREFNDVPLTITSSAHSRIRAFFSLNRLMRLPPCCREFCPRRLRAHHLSSCRLVRQKPGVQRKGYRTRQQEHLLSTLVSLKLCIPIPWLWI